MSDPQLLSEFESNVTYWGMSDTEPKSPAIPIFSAQPRHQSSDSSTSALVHAPGSVGHPASRPRATNHQRDAKSPTSITYPPSVISYPDAQTADTANPSPDTRPSLLLGSPKNPATTPRTIDLQQFLVQSPAAVVHGTSYNLVTPSFGAQPLNTSSRPHLYTPKSPLYVPTGELVNENIQILLDIDTPSTRRFTDTLSTSPTNPTSSPKSLAGSAPASDGNANVSVNKFAQPLHPRSALKRKADSIVSPPSEASVNQPSLQLGTLSGSEFDSINSNPRSVTFERMSGIGPTSPDEGSNSSELPSTSRAHQNSGPSGGTRRVRQPSGSTPRQAQPLPAASSQASVRGRGTRTSSGHPPLSGASISSDAPSYFTQFFEEQIRQNEESGGVRTLYIDRDPATFRDVARHLQGYYVKPLDGSHFVKLFADAQFYSLPRLIDQLFESEIYIQIGEKHFQIPKDIFSEPGNSPNFFSLGFAVFFSTPGEVFPGLDRRGLLRPPSITPPYVPGRSAEIFAELLHLLRGYPLHIKNDSHRAELLRDCRYFHLRGLEQKIIAHEITFNVLRQRSEICLRLEDVKPSGVSVTNDDVVQGDKPNNGGWVYYARPFVDDTSYEMVLQVGGENTLLDLTDMRADFHNLTKARISSLFQVVANKMNLPTNAPLGLLMLSGGRSSQSASPGHTPLSEDRVKVRFEEATEITLDGESYEVEWESPLGQCMLNGPSVNPSESESESDVMSEDTGARATRAQVVTHQRRPQTRQGPAGPATQSTASSSTTSRASLPVPPIQTSRLSSAPSTKKRKRQSSQSDLGEWTIRTGQWRLRVQPNTQDPIRGGYEIIFVGVKIDAYSSERARNARRPFLS
ncbi:hypothetical protein B0A52_04620 [Exophiala mesophila]|uniref:Potassium channel tetramerisation-type BTB domain-containing protein n=1 Tax=Exophiala mesophila TaxID=212818 RepID=A0A438N8S5_EXOME|nr:hypothetical protein B0A52_04620 [Exophiala mesophila]